MLTFGLLAFLACASEPDVVAPADLAATPLEEPGPSTDRLVIEERRKALYARIRAFVTDLEAAGRYDCCVRVPCTHCAVLAGGCACGEGLRRGEPVCEECAILWMKGQGDEPGVSKEQVRSFLEANREMEQPRAPCACEQDKGGEHKPAR